MNKIAISLAITAAILLAYAYKASVMPSRPAVPQEIVQLPSQEQLAFVRGAQLYCHEKFDLPSCLAYLQKCGDLCVSNLSPESKNRIVLAYNDYASKNNRKAFPFRNPASNKFIGH